jgi:hypothetical protein
MRFQHPLSRLNCETHVVLYRMSLWDTWCIVQDGTLRHVVLYMALWHTLYYTRWNCETQFVLYMALWHMYYTRWHCETHVVLYRMALWDTCCIIHGIVTHMLYYTRWHCETHVVLYMTLWHTLYYTRWHCETHVLHTQSRFLNLITVVSSMETVRTCTTLTNKTAF